MSNTIVDMPKVTQMLDAGWKISIHKNALGSYDAHGWHPNGRIRDALAKKLRKGHESVKGQTLTYETEYDWTEQERLITDDFTPEQALTRLAYKVHGEIL